MHQGRPFYASWWPLECTAISIMPKHDHHKAAEHHDEAGKSHGKDAEANEPGDAGQASQHSQIANDPSSKASEESNQAHKKTKGPKKL